MLSHLSTEFRNDICICHNDLETKLSRPQKNCLCWCPKRITRLVFVLMFILSGLNVTKSSTSDFEDASSSFNGDGGASMPEENDGYLLLCLTDGTIYSVSAWTGSYRSKIRTNPLLQTHHQIQEAKRQEYSKASKSNTDVPDDEVVDEDDDNENLYDDVSIKNAIIPGLDGRLYWTNEQTRQLTELPLTIHSLLENPVRSCDPYHPDIDCGILTAESETSLLALSSTGKLLWKTETTATRVQDDTEHDEDTDERGSVYDDHSDSKQRNKQLEGPKATQPTLFLQRKDYWVQHVLSSTGRQSWNASLGTYQALDFGPEDAGREDLDDESDYDNIESLLAQGSIMLDEKNDNNKKNDNHENQQSRKRSDVQRRLRLPLIHFSNSGHTLTAVHPKTGTILWRQDVPSILSSVFGIHEGRWETLEVLESKDALLGDTSYQYSVPRLGESPKVSNAEHKTIRNPLLLLSDTNHRDTPKVLGSVRMSIHNDAYYYTQTLWQQYQKSSKEMLNTIESHGLYNRNRNQQPSANLPMLLLPSGAEKEMKNKFNDRRDDKTSKDNNGSRVCPITGNGFIENGRFCQPHQSPVFGRSNPTKTHLLLPSPSTIPSTVSVQSQPEGLLLSWGVVSALALVILSSILGFYVWYKLKKAKWIHDTDEATRMHLNQTLQIQRDGNDSSTTTTVVSSFSSDQASDFVKGRTRSVGSPILESQYQPQRSFKRSLSLPGTWNGGGHAIEPVLNVGNFSRHNATDVIVTIEEGKSRDEPFVQLTDLKLPQPMINPTKEHQEKESTTFAMTSTVGGFPLVQYSRYQSEFQESRPMGKGGFGTVFSCRNVLDGRDYAIKKVSITGELTSSNNQNSSASLVFEQQLQRVLREVKVLAVLDHPNIVRYYTAWLEIVNGDDENGKKKGQDNEHSHVHSDDISSSQCYSSSLLLKTDSVSQWDVPGRHGRVKGSNWGYRNNSISRNSYSALGWDGTGFAIEESEASSQEETSTPYISHLANTPSDDDFLVFECDEDENDGKESFQPESDKTPRNSSKKLTTTSMTDSFIQGDVSSADNIGKKVRMSEVTSTMSLLHRQGDLATTDSAQIPENGQAEVQGQTSIVTTIVRHTLYIQMELCSQKTMANFLQDSEMRCLGRPLITQSTTDPVNKGNIDIPKALRLFLQIAEAVKHVHNQGLIHRDLKPSNCFLNEPQNGSTTVKVGDFGLSRHEQSSVSDLDNLDNARQKVKRSESRIGLSEDHTAGVGTRLYASPEQMNGSDYDSSTDVFSLGIILFELLYPMYTGMERNICLSKLRDSLPFPSDWHMTIGSAFPDLEDMIRRMVLKDPSARPTAESVAKHVSSILGEFTVLSLDVNHNSDPDIFMLRVEAEHRVDTLGHTMRLIHEISTSFLLEDFETCQNELTIVQYGLRSSSSVGGGKPSAIMEFALKFTDSSAGVVLDTRDENECCATVDLRQQNLNLFSKLVSKLMERPGIYKVRQISWGTA